MGSIWKENWKRGAKKDSIGAEDDHDLVRIEDLEDISANATGILGSLIVGTASEGDGLIFQGGQWVIALTNASGLNGIQIVGAPSTNEILKFDGTSWVPGPDGSGLPSVTTLGDPGLDTQTVTEQGIREGLTSALAVGRMQVLNSQNGAGLTKSRVISGGTLASNNESIIFMGVLDASSGGETLTVTFGVSQIFTGVIPGTAGGLFYGTIHRVSSGSAYGAVTILAGSDVNSNAILAAEDLTTDKTLTVAWGSANNVNTLTVIKASN